jgi:hypothetical protein
MANWKCIDCKTHTLTRLEFFVSVSDSDSEIKISSKVSVCTTCRRVHDENGGELTVNGKAVYRIGERFVFKTEE